MPPSAVDAIRHHALHVHEDVSAMLSAGPILEEDSVHGLRVAAKEIRALWQLLKPLLDDTRAEQAITELRDAAATLSEARDQFVIIETLKTLSDKARSRDTRDALLDALAQLGAHWPEDQSRAANSRQLQDAWHHDLQRWQTLSIDISREALLQEGYGRLYRKARKLTHSACEADSIEQWHALRKWVKYLALTLPLSGNRKKTAALTADVTRLGKKLGKLHDLDRLLHALSALDWSRSHAEQHGYVCHEIHRHISRILGDCQSQAMALFDEPPPRFVKLLS
jgi:hypothetical protein